MATAVGQPAASIKVSRQIILPWRKSLAMAYNSLRLRPFRSLVTLISLALAIAFLAYTLANTALAGEFYRLHGESALSALRVAGYSFDASSASVTAGPSEIWLMVLSLLVCTVGIVNAQLMSVTERFREIGIMKCLGALDRMILRLFLIEALLIGILGAGMGTFLGVGVAWLASPLSFPGLDHGGVALAPLFGEAMRAWAAGILLSLVGVAYPAILAARLQPVLVMKEEY
jgi:putative ABC transport system permease protein